MLPALRTEFTPEVIAEGLSRFEASGAVLLSEWHNLTFGCQRHGASHAVRMSHSKFRESRWIQGELDWILELLGHGIVSPLPVASRSRNLVEVVPVPGGEISVVCFTALRGREISAADWNDALFARWGELLGRLHRSTASTKPIHARPLWHEADFLDVGHYLPAGDEVVLARAHALIHRLKALPATPTNFGLIHADMYQDNLRILPDGRLELFDYDNAEHGFFASDIANSLYAALWREPDPARRDEFAKRFLGAFGDGYNRHFLLAANGPERLRDFLMLRDVLIYTVACKNLDLSKITARQSQLLAERRQRIVQQRPVVELP